MNRTRCLASTFATVVLSAALSSATEPIDVGDRVCLFLDDRFVAKQVGLERTWHQGKPLENPAIASSDLVDRWPHLFGSVVYDPQDKLYKMWYSSIREGMFYAESRDGKAWSKPKLGIHTVDGSKDNNLVSPAVALPNVFLDPNEKDPKARFKLFAWDTSYYSKLPIEERANGHKLFRSGDGIHWDPVGAGVPGSLVASSDRCSNFICSDTNQVIWDSLAGRYLVTFRTYPKHWPEGEFEAGRRRSIGITTAQQITGPWQPIVKSVVPDEQDDKAAALAMRDVPPDSKKWAELYVMPLFTYGNHYVGLLSPIHVANVGNGKLVANAPGGGDLQLAFSHDGMKWHRPAERPPLIAPSTAAELHPVYAACSAPLEMDKEIWIYYAEANSSHPSEKDPKAQIRAAAWRKDGFVSLDTEGKGSLTTPPLVFTGKQLRVNFQGSVTVTVLDDREQRIESLSPQTLTGDSVAQAVEWDMSTLAGRPIRLRFDVEKGHLWSFRFAP